MSELNLQPETMQIDTNTEYILPAEEKKQPPVLLSVSKAIIIETVKDFFRSIIGFFLRYIRHFIRCLVYFVNPSLQKKPFNKLDFKENSQHAFEFVIIVLALLIFMIKQGWIPASDKGLSEIYNNDLMQKGMEIALFVIFILAYLLLAGLSILFGRMFRRMFHFPLTKHESDILFIYLHNAFFSIAAVIVFIVRCSASTETYDTDSIVQVLAIIVFPSIILPTIIWSIRFAYLHKAKVLKGIGFTLLSVILFSLFYGLGIWIVTAFAIGI